MSSRNSTRGADRRGRRRAPRRRTLPRRTRQALRLAGVFAALVLVNVYVFFFRRGTSLGSVLRAASAPLPGDAAGLTQSRTGVAPGGMAGEAPDGVAERASTASATEPRTEAGRNRIFTAAVRAGSSLRVSLARQGVARADSLAAGEAVMAARWIPSDLAGATYSATLDARGRLLELVLRPAPPTPRAIFRRRANGRFAVATR